MRYIACLFVGLLMLAACDDPTGTSPKMKIAMLSSTNGFDDLGFNMLAKLGLSRISENYDVDVEFKECLSAANFKNYIMDLAKGDANLIFGLGYDMAPAIELVSQSYFQKAYGLVDFKFENEYNNVVCATFKVEQACYPLGYLAAYYSRLVNVSSPKVAFIGGEKSPNISAFLNGFSLGLSRYNQFLSGNNVGLIVEYVDSYNDSAKAYQITKELIATGVNVFFPVAGISGRGCFRAVKEANLYAIGFDTDCYLTFPEYKAFLLSSCIKRIDNAVYSIAEYFIKNKRIMDTEYIGTLNNDGVGIAPYHDFDSRIHDTIKTQILTIIDDIKSRRINL